MRDSLSMLGLGLVLAFVGSIGCGPVDENTDLLQQGLSGGGGGAPIPSGGSGGSGYFTVDLQNGNGSYNGVQDATIDAGDPDTFLGGLPTCTADGLTRERACLMSFNVTGIPYNATVAAAALTINILDRSTRIYEFFELKQAWSGQLGTTWNRRLLSTPWATPGAKGTADREATSFAYFTPSALGPKTVPFDAAGVALVQRWVSQPPGTNYGFVIARPDVDNGVIIASSQSPNIADRPRLRVTYSVP